MELDKEETWIKVNLVVSALFLFVMFNLALNLIQAGLSVGLNIFSELLFSNYQRIDLYSWLSSILKIGIYLITVYLIYYFSKEMLFLLKYNRQIMEERIKSNKK